LNALAPPGRDQSEAALNFVVLAGAFGPIRPVILPLGATRLSLFTRHETPRIRILRSRMTILGSKHGCLPTVAMLALHNLLQTLLPETSDGREAELPTDSIDPLHATDGGQ